MLHGDVPMIWSVSRPVKEMFIGAMFGIMSNVCVKLVVSKPESGLKGEALYSPKASGGGGCKVEPLESRRDTSKRYITCTSKPSG